VWNKPLPWQKPKACRKQKMPSLLHAAVPLALLVAVMTSTSSAFYLPGVAPRAYAKVICL
jgi:hypothetical protein